MSGFRRNHDQRTQRLARGFSLLELLVVIVILLSLLSAFVLNVETLWSGASFDNGVTRFKTLLRLVRAEAAKTGRTVRLEFVDGFESNLRVKLLREAEPLKSPGKMQELTDGFWEAQLQNEAVRVESCDLVDRPFGDGWGEERISDNVLQKRLDAVSFYPDGSNDSATIVLIASSGSDKRRRILLRLLGTTGGILEEEIAARAADSIGLPTGELSGAQEAATSTAAPGEQRW